ncbi:methyl-accepting chemotaxis sensory transducer [Thiorhodococcus drewsii AZ1]|uniref:Methyl-accepting chemotaxis sensory transducer n=1 Tax=Thiorhodococcus drewsii AZ1 TaxID=765913 RepID=G2E5U1_9GAMM|nr:methyl-accepting chemotaxis protein [Thiorhodococcus drewsii]EGV28586.1 methyl-accepting chemotaxis sensory transducer [Thiorhodococcus drewsii AZ1]
MHTAATLRHRTSTKNAKTLRYDKILLLILLAHLPVTIFLVPIGYGTSDFALSASLMVGTLTVAAYLLLRGTPSFGLVSAILLMALSAIMIQSELGRIEMHFHIFCALAILLIYRNWVYILVAVALISVHHLGFTALQLNGTTVSGMPIMLFNDGCSWSLTALHVTFIAVEGLVLIAYAILMRRDEQVADMLMGAISVLDDKRDLTLQIIDEDKSPILGAFNDTLRKFAILTRNVSNAADEIRSVSKQLGHIARTAEEDISEQHAQTKQAARAIGEMSKRIEAVAANTRSAADVADAANLRAFEGQDRFNRAVRSTAELQQIMVEAYNSIRLLKSNAERIGLVVDVIRGISEQTNLVALNAAIESARAGEHGRGFTLVADEVRELAQHTQDSTKEIQAMIQKIQTDIENSVAQTDYGHQKSTATSTEILQAGLALNEILESVSQISIMNDQVAQAVDQQSKVVESIDSSIRNIATHNANVIEKSKTNLSSASTLQKVSKTLDRMATTYRH